MMERPAAAIVRDNRAPPQNPARLHFPVLENPGQQPEQAPLNNIREFFYDIADQEEPAIPVNVFWDDEENDHEHDNEHEQEAEDRRESGVVREEEPQDVRTTRQRRTISRAVAASAVGLVVVLILLAIALIGAVCGTGYCGSKTHTISKTTVESDSVPKLMWTDRPTAAPSISISSWTFTSNSSSSSSSSSSDGATTNHSHNIFHRPPSAAPTFAPSRPPMTTIADADHSPPSFQESKNQSTIANHNINNGTTTQFTTISNVTISRPTTSNATTTANSTNSSMPAITMPSLVVNTTTSTILTHYPTISPTHEHLITVPAPSNTSATATVTTAISSPSNSSSSLNTTSQDNQTIIWSTIDRLLDP